ncbi:MAG: histidine kinase [Hyphomicrobiales bacterium]|nr:histidine kinase [Hyphomicrobiales bacterium]
MNEEPREIQQGARLWQEPEQPENSPGGLEVRKGARSLRTHLLVLAIVVLIPQIILGSIISYRYADDARANIERQTIAGAERYAQELDRYLEGAVASIQALAGSVHSTPDSRDLYDRAQELLPLRGSAIVMRDRTGQQVLNTTLPYGTPLPPTASAAVREADELVFTTGEVAFSNVYTGTTNKDWFVLADVPVRIDGEIRYAMNIAIRSQDLRDRLLRQIPEGWLATILDKDFRVIARAVDHARFVGQKANQPIINAIMTGNSGTTRSTTLDGRQVFASFTKSQISGWTTVISVRLDIMEQPLRALWRDLALLALLSIAFSTAAALLWSRRLMRGMKQIKEDALLLADEKTIRQSATGVSELDDLNLSMIDAAAKLKVRSKRQRTLLAELNHRVKNTLAIVQSIAGRTVTEGGGAPTVAASLSGRVAALAAAHDALTHADWGGADLGDLVGRVGAINGIEVETEGPGVLLTPKATVAMAQVLHELAARGGGARPKEPKVEPPAIVWAIEEERLWFTWFDLTGDMQRPAAGSFSEKIIDLSMTRQLDGAYAWGAGEEGWTFEAHLPLRSTMSDNARAATF